MAKLGGKISGGRNTPRPGCYILLAQYSSLWLLPSGQATIGVLKFWEGSIFSWASSLLRNTPAFPPLGSTGVPASLSGHEEDSAVSIFV